MWIYKNWEWFVMKHAHKDCNYFALADFDPVLDFCAPAVAAKTRLVKEEPEAIRAFVKASDQGFVDAASDPEEAAKILHGYTPHFALDLLVESQQYISGLYLNENGRWGTIRPERWDRFSAFMQEKGMTKKNISGENGGYTNAFHD